jgi:hypothetical protein
LSVATEPKLENRIFTSPKQFNDAFLQVASEYHSQLSESWLKLGFYTALMRETVLPRVADKLKLRSWPKEYYSLDSVFYREKDTEHFGEHIMNAKFIEVALEHEHVLSGTAQEMNKLQLFSAPLKVLITYDETDAERAHHLKRYREIIESADIFCDIHSLRRQLVIFGRKAAETINWSAYVYEREGFVPLQYLT